MCSPKILPFASVVLAAVVVAALAAPPALAQCEIQKLTASDADAGDGFGRGVDMWSSWAVIGAPGDGAAGPAAGAVYVYRGTARLFERTKLIADDADPGDMFGSVAIDYRRIVVGAPLDEEEVPNTGSAYVFDWDSDDNAWVQDAKLLASDANEGALFGWTVDVWGGRVAIAAPLADDGDGAVYVFRRVEEVWNEEAKLSHPGTPTDVSFGHCAAIHGYGGRRVIVVGCPSDSSDQAGAVYVFRYETDAWVLEAELAGPAVEGIDRFGASVAIDDGRIVVGAPHSSANTPGAAHVFRCEGTSWFEEAALAASDAAVDDQFGASVDIDGDRILIGASWNQGDVSPPVNPTGAAYLFAFDGVDWVEEAKLQASDAAEGDEFGLSVSLYGSYALVGAWRDDDACPDDPECDSGSAYFYAFSDYICECAADVDDDGQVGLADLAQVLTCYGSPWPPDCWDCDFDNDGDVDLTDLAFLLYMYGLICP